MIREVIGADIKLTALAATVGGALALGACAPPGYCYYDGFVPKQRYVAHPDLPAAASPNAEELATEKTNTLAVNSCIMRTIDHLATLRPGDYYRIAAENYGGAVEVLPREG